MSAASRTRGRFWSAGPRCRYRWGLWLREAPAPRAARPPDPPGAPQLLRFEAGGAVVYARQVRGTPGDRWLIRALEATVPYPVIEH